MDGRNRVYLQLKRAQNLAIDHIQGRMNGVIRYAFATANYFAAKLLHALCDVMTAVGGMRCIAH